MTLTPPPGPSTRPLVRWGILLAGVALFVALGLLRGCMGWTE